MIHADDKIRRNPHVVAHELGQEQGGVLLRLDTGEYHGVNPTGWTIWNLIEGTRTPAEVAADLRSRLEEEPPTLAEDVSLFLSELVERRLIELASAEEHAAPPPGNRDSAP